MNLIDKLETIDFQKTYIIPEDDMFFCRKHFEFYSKVYKTYENHLSCMTELEAEQKIMFKDNYSSYIWRYDGIASNKTIEVIISLTESFISEISRYFEKKYSIKINEKSLPPSSINNEREQRFCELNELLESIIDNLDGLSFFEKAIEQMKIKSKTKRVYVNWLDNYNFDIKGKTIKFRRTIDIENIRPSLYFYDNDEKEILDYYVKNKIEKEKRFDNGNIDISFKKAEYALDYARKYLGYNTAV